MKILFIHSYYRDIGGENVLVDDEKKLLREHGHHVIELNRQNNTALRINPIHLGISTVWSKSSYDETINIIEKEKPDIAHVHNTFPLISPSIYYACKKKNVPIVQTIHNYRLMCINGVFYREKKICHECLNKKNYIPGIIHKCYKNNLLQSTAIGFMNTIHKRLNTWNKIKAFIVPSEYVKKIFIDSNLIDKKKIFVCNNFVFPNHLFKKIKKEEKYALFVGRLTYEKGILTLLNAWNYLTYKLIIIGKGPIQPKVEEFIKKNNKKNIIYLREKTRDEILKFISKSYCLIVPSEWEETSVPLVAIEAMSCCTPVISTCVGGLQDLKDKNCMLFFKEKNIDDLIQKVKYAFKNPDLMSSYAKNAYKIYTTKYSDQSHYDTLIDIYSSVCV